VIDDEINFHKGLKKVLVSSKVSILMSSHEEDLELIKEAKNQGVMIKPIRISKLVEDNILKQLELIASLELLIRPLLY